MPNGHEAFWLTDVDRPTNNGRAIRFLFSLSFFFFLSFLCFSQPIPSQRTLPFRHYTRISILATRERRDARTTKSKLSKRERYSLCGKRDEAPKGETTAGNEDVLPCESARYTTALVTSRETMARRVARRTPAPSKRPPHDFLSFHTRHEPTGAFLSTLSECNYRCNPISRCIIVETAPRERTLHCTNGNPNEPLAPLRNENEQPTPLSVNPCYGGGVNRRDEEIKACWCSLVTGRLEGIECPRTRVRSRGRCSGRYPPVLETRRRERGREKKGTESDNSRGGEGARMACVSRSHTCTHTHARTHLHTRGEKKVDTRRRTRRGPRSDRVEGRYSTAAAREAHPPPRPQPAYFPDPFTPTTLGRCRHVAPWLSLPRDTHGCLYT